MYRDEITPRERDAYFAGYLQARGRISTHRRPSEYYEHGEDVRRALLEIQCPEETAAAAADHFQAGNTIGKLQIGEMDIEQGRPWSMPPRSYGISTIWRRTCS
jgi:hypothetical protein